jgi:uncharacterized coiled-coil protein SlyX
MPDLEHLDERLVDLEVRTAFQERTITALDDVVRALVMRVDELARKVEELEKQRETPA